MHLADLFILNPAFQSKNFLHYDREPVCQKVVPSVSKTRTRRTCRKTDKLAKVRRFFDSFLENCQQFYTSGDQFMIDEKLEPLPGRCLLNNIICQIVFLPFLFIMVPEQIKVITKKNGMKYEAEGGKKKRPGILYNAAPPKL
ncbi:hypothetical protein AVEN_217020-1 [Araneus ventricosus]|uniref:PiggyBac transposable element-derived protein domain-containing protein n=1 Tax=Araneus ventricosus TaxID=182803 RepID=A0A4Y2NKP5_ARAVE|nr:hypothetical protein AVEN_217020-1 [Araneus ventricosus]